MLEVTEQPEVAVSTGQPGPSGRPADDGSGPHIRCPLCRWTPSKTDLWACSCAHQWNTFETKGLCPACFLQWAYTACLQCGILSLHTDWYVTKRP
jgi:hypothetical protein